MENYVNLGMGVELYWSFPPSYDPGDLTLPLVVWRSKPPYQLQTTLDGGGGVGRNCKYEQTTNVWEKYTLFSMNLVCKIQERHF